MNEHAINVFFYGSYLNFKVLDEVDISERPFETGCLHGYQLTIAPLANLEYNPRASVYGILTRLTHAELERLYRDHAAGLLGGEYLPEAVLVSLTNGRFVPAQCYLSHRMAEAKADPAYVDRILNPSRVYGFPDWYLHHIESFK